MICRLGVTAGRSSVDLPDHDRNVGSHPVVCRTGVAAGRSFVDQSVVGIPRMTLCIGVVDLAVHDCSACLKQLGDAV